ncbi:hypothetical protein PHAVU_009G221500 [Phaseolus vulgaris]|uniref:Uncharacterized protein n=1 Tax=Phaseolus vulgaris TaxID=3885 RepID=V7AY49_PHAVU|nr:hypothetical protein PHAVU_009G221500g [Phaseolus vulgaris]ESW10582.1 hypothetical protein PHAVU_009G221500g [Phaseolus vulgaris]
MGCKGPFCVLKSCFKSGRRNDYECWESSERGRRRIFASDEDREHWVAEPGIDKKASDFIAKYYTTRFTRQFPS